MKTQTWRSADYPTWWEFIQYIKGIYNPPPPHSDVFLAIYAPMIYTAPCIIFLMRADIRITRASGRGLGPGVFWAL
jgi:hypothetical protein